MGEVLVQLALVPGFLPTFLIMSLALGVLALAYLASRTRHYRGGDAIAALAPIGACVQRRRARRAGVRRLGEGPHRLLRRRAAGHRRHAGGGHGPAAPGAAARAARRGGERGPGAGGALAASYCAPV
jgi:hypothetical protein